MNYFALGFVLVAGGTLRRVCILCKRNRVNVGDSSDRVSDCSEEQDSHSVMRTVSAAALASLVRFDL
jgi:hypothetical protein